MCDNCIKWAASLTGNGMRDTLTEVEIARWKRLKQIKDSRKLQSMLPAWIKTHNAKCSIPHRTKFISGAKPTYPPIPTGADHKRIFDTDHIARRDRTFPRMVVENILEYAEEFGKLNHLKPSTIEIVRVRSFG